MGIYTCTLPTQTNGGGGGGGGDRSKSSSTASHTKMASAPTTPTTTTSSPRGFYGDDTANATSLSYKVRGMWYSTTEVEEEEE